MNPELLGRNRTRDCELGWLTAISWEFSSCIIWFVLLNGCRYHKCEEAYGQFVVCDDCEPFLKQRPRHSLEQYIVIGSRDSLEYYIVIVWLVVIIFNYHARVCRLVEYKICYAAVIYRVMQFCRINRFVDSSRCGVFLALSINQNQ